MDADTTPASPRRLIFLGKSVHLVESMPPDTFAKATWRWSGNQHEDYRVGRDTYSSLACAADAGSPAARWEDDSA